MKKRRSESCISRRIILLCILMALLSQVALCVNAKQRTKQKSKDVNNESFSQIGSIENQNKHDNQIKDSSSSKIEQVETVSEHQNVSQQDEKIKEKKPEKMGMISLVQKQMSILKNLTIHLGSQRDIYVAIALTIIIFSIAYYAILNNKQDFPFLRNLDLQQTFQSKAKLERQKKKQEEDEQFYNSYNLSGSSNRSLNNSEGDSYLSASDYKLQRQQVDILNSLEWQRMKDRAQKYSAFENNPQYQDFKMKIQQENNRKTKKNDDTIDFNENNIDINDLLKQLDDQSFIGSKHSCDSSNASNVLKSTNAIVI